MNNDIIVQFIIELKNDGISLEDIQQELNYRDRANDFPWDDNLYEYTTEELEDIEQLWCEVA